MLLLLLLVYPCSPQTKASFSPAEWAVLKMSVLSSLRKQAVSCVCRPFLKIYIIGRSLWAKEKGGKVSAGQTYTIKYKNTQYSNKHICKTITRMKIDQFRVVAHFKFAATFIIYFPRIKKTHQSIFEIPI